MHQSVKARWRAGTATRERPTPDALPCCKSGVTEWIFGTSCAADSWWQRSDPSLLASPCLPTASAVTRQRGPGMVAVASPSHKVLGRELVRYSDPVMPPRSGQSLVRAGRSTAMGRSMPLMTKHKHMPYAKFVSRPCESIVVAPHGRPRTPHGVLQLSHLCNFVDSRPSFASIGPKSLETMVESGSMSARVRPGISLESSPALRRLFGEKSATSLKSLAKFGPEPATCRAISAECGTGRDSRLPGTQHCIPSPPKRGKTQHNIPALRLRRNTTRRIASRDFVRASFRDYATK